MIFKKRPAWLTCKSKCLRSEDDEHESWCVYIQSRAQLGDVKQNVRGEEKLSRTKKLRFLLTPVARDTLCQRACSLSRERVIPLEQLPMHPVKESMDP